MVDDRILIPPQDLARFRIQAGRPHGAEMDIDAARLDHGAGRRMAILGIDPKGVRGSKNFKIAFDFTRVKPGTDDPQRMPFLRRRGEPNLIVGNDRRGPAQALDRDLPDDARLLAPFDGKSGLRRLTLPVGAAELGTNRPRTRHPRQGRPASPRQDMREIVGGIASTHVVFPGHHDGGCPRSRRRF